MSTPIFTAEASLYMPAGSYRAATVVVASGSRIIPAIPLCGNCDYICDVCVETGRACGACALCAVGMCEVPGRPRIP